MATPKQIDYIVALMVEKGHAHPRGFLHGSAKTLPHGPSMRERQGDARSWASRLTIGQASEVIGALKV